jgi:competence protein ComEC
VALAIALASFVAGDILLQQSPELPGAAALAAGASAGLLAIAAAAAFRRGTTAPGARWALAALGAALAGWAYAGWQAHDRMAEELRFADEGRELRIQGVVASLPTRFDAGLRFVFCVERVLGTRPDDSGPAPAIPRRISLSWYEPAGPVLPAERWEMNVRLRRPHASVNPAGFDAEAWMLEQGIRAQGSVRSGARSDPPRRIDERVWQFNPLVDRVRAQLRERLQQVLQERRYGSVIVALVMGDQASILVFGKKGLPQSNLLIH